MFTFKRLLFSGVATVASAAIMSGCGSRSSDSSSLSVSLNSIPSVSGMITTNSSTQSYGLVNVNRYNAVGLQAVSGTPETISSYASDANLLDADVFGGSIASILANTADVSNAEKTAFWKGQGTCMLMQSVGESLGRMLEQGTSMCYMRNVPASPGAFTITSGSIDDPTQLFVQQTSDRIVKFQVSDQGQTEDIFIKVFGTNNVGADVYKVQLYFCQQGSSKGGETIEVNKATGIYSGSGIHSGNFGQGRQTVTAYLKTDASGNVVFDPSKDRTALSHWSGTWGGGSSTFKGYVLINGDNKMYGKRYNQGPWGTDKNYAVTSFSGTSMSTLRFLEGAFVGSSTWDYDSHTYSGASQFQDTAYASVDSSDLLTEVNAYSLATDTFFTQDLTVSVSPTDDCTASADITGTINMDSAAMQAIQTTCEADRFNNYSMCWSDNIRTAQEVAY